MAEQIIFGKISKKINSTSSAMTNVLTTNVLLKKNTSIVSPVMEIKADFATLRSCNYAKYAGFCYHIDKIECDMQAKMYDLEGVFLIEKAKEDLLEWCKKIENTKTKLPEFKKVALTYKHWIKPIVNSFIIDIDLSYSFFITSG